MGKEHVSQGSSKDVSTPKGAPPSQRTRNLKQSAPANEQDDGYRLQDIPILPPSAGPQSGPPPQLEQEIASRLSPDETSLTDQQVSQIASEGLSGTGEPLPQLATLQQAFGGVDLSSIRVHSGPRAERSALKLSAQAYTRGEHIALAGQPSLQDLAHETAHVLQQRYQPSTLPTGLSDPSHQMERQAESIASRVSQGASVPSFLPISTPGPSATPSQQMPVMRIQRNNAQDKIRKAKDKQAYLTKCLLRQAKNSRVAAFEIWQWFMMYTKFEDGTDVYEHYRYAWDEAANRYNIGSYPAKNAKSSQDVEDSSQSKKSNLSTKSAMASDSILKNINKSNSHRVAHTVSNVGATAKDVADLTFVSDTLVNIGREKIIHPIEDKIDQQKRAAYEKLQDNEIQEEQEEDVTQQNTFNMEKLNNSNPELEKKNDIYADFLFGTVLNNNNQKESDDEEVELNQANWVQFDQADNADESNLDEDNLPTNSLNVSNNLNTNATSSLLGHNPNIEQGLKHSANKLKNKGIDTFLSSPSIIAKQFSKGFSTIGKGIGALAQSGGKSFESNRLLKLTQIAYEQAIDYEHKHKEQIYDKEVAAQLINALKILVLYPWGGNAQVIISSAANSGFGGFGNFDSNMNYGVDNLADSEDVLSGTETKSNGLYHEAKKSQNFKSVHRKIQKVKGWVGHDSHSKDIIADAIYAGLRSDYPIDNEIAKAIVFGPLGHTNATFQQIGLSFDKPGGISKYLREVQLSGGD